MSEGNAIRVIENQPEAAAIEIPHEVGRDPRCSICERDSFFPDVFTSAVTSPRRSKMSTKAIKCDLLTMRR